MFPAFILLGLLSVGSIVFFARFALLRPGGGLVPVVQYGLVDLVFILVLAGYDVFLGCRGFHSTPETVTFNLLVANAVLTLGLLTIAFGLLVGRWLDPLELFGLLGRSPRAVVLPALGSILAIVPLILFSQCLVTFFCGPAPPQPLILFVQHHPRGGDLLMFLFTAVILAPFAEEILFRGYMYGVFKRYAGRGVATIVSALVFAAVHGHLPSLPGLFLLAVALTLAYEFTGSLWTTMLIHAGFNSFSVIVAIFWPQLG